MSFGTFLQENLLVLLAFDAKRCKIIRSTVEPHLFGGFYKEIASRIYDFIDRQGEPPNEHVADILEDKIKSKNKRERNTYKDILSSLHDLKEDINAEYVMSQLEGFVTRQNLRSVAVDLAKALQRDTEDSLVEAQELIRGATTSNLKVFDPGVRLSDIERTLRFLDNQYYAFPIGIREFDQRGFGPSRKEMFLYVADTKTGKTWCMIHLAKIVLMNRLRCVHISLEMDEDKIIQRYMQTFFAISKRKEKFRTTRFKKDKRGKVTFDEKIVKPRTTFEDKNIRSKLKRNLKRWQNRVFDNIIVKQFPTGKLTVRELEVYLDNLEATQGFVPDLLIVDYPDLMKLEMSSGGQYRHGLAETYKGLRGVGVARNIAVACPTQSNRAASGAKHVGRTSVSEAYAKIADADVAITYSQTEMEKQLGLARLKVVAGRNDVDNLEVAISQNYNMGMFVIDSVPMNSDYWGLVDTTDGTADDEDDDYD